MRLNCRLGGDQNGFHHIIRHSWLTESAVCLWCCTIISFPTSVTCKSMEKSSNMKNFSLKRRKKDTGRTAAWNLAQNPSLLRFRDFYVLLQLDWVCLWMFLSYKATERKVWCHDWGFILWPSHLSSTVTIVLTSWWRTPASALSLVVWTASSC